MDSGGAGRGSLKQRRRAGRAGERYLSFSFSFSFSYMAISVIQISENLTIS